jgi:predicted MPP superfamily phosphohydrolase
MPQQINVIKTRLRIPGLQKTLRILHVTDVHLAECDRRDPQQRRFLAWVDEHQGGNALANFDRLIALLPKLAPDFIAFTGDMMDSATHANWEALTTRLRSLRIPYGLTFGNHDWDLPRHGTQDRDQGHRKKLWQKTARACSRHPEFEVFSLAGIRLVFLDNSDYQVSPGQFRRLNRELRKSKPTLLFYHIPVSLPSLRPAVIDKWSDPIMCGEPDWEPMRRRRWRVLAKTPRTTREFRQRVMRDRTIAAAFTGHVHFDHQDRLPSGARQYVTPPLYQSHVRLITLIPA